MEAVRRFIVIHRKGDMRFIIPQIIRLLAIVQPGQLKRKGSFSIPYINQCKTGALFPLNRLKTKRPLVESKAVNAGDLRAGRGGGKRLGAVADRRDAGR